ncbi:hypothetical protein M569_12630 [Genlisea aurea]|uniref:Uncharacterized protein n=1 Tax=Genlisea aurea TaxID=192259 RepID=S8C5R2_9LAMI|nr:hypothetical protein M569_12630 [Genlisea aurea]
MEKPVTLKPLGIKDESSSAISKKGSKSKKSSKASAHKNGAVKARKPLNDITNKSAVHHETPSGRKNQRKSVVEDDEYFLHSEAVLLPKFRRNILLNNIAEEEGFLHDHNKCVEAQESVTGMDFWNTVLPDSEKSLTMIVEEEEEEEKMNQLVELSMEEEEEELMLMRCWKSPPSSPKLCCRSSPPLPDFIWELQVFELNLKEEDDD